MLTSVAAIATLLGIGVARVARAADVQPGVHAGNATIVPSLALLGTYRTNVYLQEGADYGGAPTTAGFALSAQPGVEITFDSQQVGFKLNGDYLARKYTNPDLSNLDRYKDFWLGGDIDLLPRSVVGVRVRDKFLETCRVTEAYYAEDAYLTEMKNQLDAQVMVRPGSSLEVGLGGEADWSDYRSPENTNYLRTANLNNRVSYGPRIDAKWKFLPKTAVVAGYEYTWLYWEDNFLDTRGAGLGREDVGDHLGMPDARLWRGFMGLRGRFTAKTVLNLTLGYGQAVYDEDSVLADAKNEVDGSDPEITSSVGFGKDLKGFPDGLIGVAGVIYEFDEHQKVDFGYQRDFADSFFTNYFTWNGFYLRYKGEFGRRLEASAAADYRFEDYFGEVERADQFTRVRGDLSVKVVDFMKVTGGVAWTGRRSDVQSVEFDDFQVQGGLVFGY